MHRLIMLSVLVLLFAAGCSNAQLPPSNGYDVLWTVSIPAPANGWAGCGAGQPSCGLVISTLAVPAGTTTCPASTGSNYTPQQTAAAPASGTTWSQPGTTGTTQCAVAQLVQTQAGQSSPSVSGASAPSNAVVSPALPLAPSVSGAQQVAALDKPKLQPTAPAPELASLEIKIIGRLVSSR